MHACISTEIHNFHFIGMVHTVGKAKMVHVVLFITGTSLLATSLHTYRLGLEASGTTLTPNQRMSLLGRKWREERNFWISVLTFSLWG